MAVVDIGSSKQGWWDVVLRLRQDQQLVVSNWKEVHKYSQELNQACDAIFRSLWISHVLGSGLSQVLIRRLEPAEWVAALDNSFVISVVDGQQGLEYDLLEAYSRFLTCLRNKPDVTSEVVIWAGNEGLGTPELLNDLITTVYGGFLFQEDHHRFLQLILYLLTHHITQCTSYKDLFVFEHEFSRAITEYCKSLSGLSEFLVSALQEPLMRVINYNKQYLEYDIAKASTRLQHGDFNIVSYVDDSCAELADMCMQVLKNLDKFKERFPASLRWITASLRQLIKKKWPSISAAEASRPIGDVFFRYIISAAFTSPDLLGILDPSIIVNEMSFYNVSQLVGVLQGCAWISSRSSSSSAEYPMKRVVKLMKLKCFTSLMDWLQMMPEDSSRDNPPVLPVLPGLKKNFFMASKDQLEDILILSHEANTHFNDLSDPNPAQRELNHITKLGPNALIHAASRNPYSFSVKKSASRDIILSDSPERNKKAKVKQRSKSMWNTNKADKLSLPANQKTSTLSSATSMTKSHSSSSDVSFGLLSLPDRFYMPREVFLIPLWHESDDKYHTHRQSTGSNLWKFELLSEEEFLRSKNQSSPPKSLHFAKQGIPLAKEEGASDMIPQHSQDSLEHSCDSFCSIPNNNRGNDDTSLKSWSPVTYNGSVSGEEDIKELQLVQDRLTKSTEVGRHHKESSHLVISEDERPEGRRKSIKAWISHRMKKKQKLEKESAHDGKSEKNVHHRVGSYTKRVSHITEKYEKISKEKKEEAAKQNSSQTEPLLPSDSPLCLHIPSGADEFITLPLYSQLKYKLSIVLSKIHIPLSPCSSPNCCAKRELLMLLEDSLHRNTWIADSSEIGVLREIITQIYDLDEDCVQALYMGVVQDQMARQEYLNYLTVSQQKFTDIRLELGSVQQLIDRSRHLIETAFLNFSVQSFLENNDEKLKQLETDLRSCETGDEICETVQKAIEDLSQLLETESMWNVWPEEDLSRVNHCLSSHLFTRVYEQTFKPNGDTDAEKDKIFSDLLNDLSSTVKPNHHLLKIQKVYLSSCPWPEVQRELLLMNAYKSPRGKLKCVIRACQLLIRSLQLSKCGEPPGADDTFPALVYVLIQSNPPDLLSTEQYIKTFCDMQLTGEDAYWWTQFQSAIGFLRTPGFTQQQ